MFENEEVRWSYRGVKKCPKCKTFNGYRTAHCRNAACRNVLLENVQKPMPLVIASKLVTESLQSIYSVRIRTTGPDYREFVELRDEENCWVLSNCIQNNSPSGSCYIKNCLTAFIQNYSSGLKDPSNNAHCQHIQACINTKHVAESLNLNNSVLDLLNLSTTMKLDMLKMVSEQKCPLVQRISKQVVVIKTDISQKHPLGYLHMLFLSSKKRYYCNCDKFALKSAKKKKTLRTQELDCKTSNESNMMPLNEKCIHFYTSIWAFASDAVLLKEFKCFVGLIVTNDDLKKIADLLSNDVYNAPSSKENDNIDQLVDEIPMNLEIENSVSLQYTTQTIELQDGNTLMMELHTDSQNWKVDDNDKINENSKVELDDVIFLKADKDNEIDMCDVFLTDNNNEQLTSNNNNKPLDIEIMFEEGSDLIKLPNFIIKELPIQYDTSLSSAKNGFDGICEAKDISGDLQNNENEIFTKEKESSNNINTFTGDDLAIFSDNYNSLEIISSEQFNNFLNKQGNYNDLYNKKSNQKLDSLSMSESDDELLFLGLNEPTTDNNGRCIVKAHKLSSLDKGSINLNKNLIKKSTKKGTKMKPVSGDAHSPNTRILIVNNNEINNLKQLLEIQNATNSNSEPLILNDSVISGIITIDATLDNGAQNINDMSILDGVIHHNRNDTTSINDDSKNLFSENIVTTLNDADVHINVNLTFINWLSSVTERINQTMHFQFNGKPNPFIYQVPHSFFECFRDRMCPDYRKKRLPDSITEFKKTEGIPLGKFIRYTWNIIKVNQVKRIFDTPEILLEITQFFLQNADGTYTKIDKPMPNKSIFTMPTPNTKHKNKLQNIRPGALITYLKVGNTAPDQIIPTPFCIEWVPNILPKSKVGELKLIFEFGHKSNFAM